ncbi:MAG: lysine decarboxylase LdcC [Negativicutes bacterium]|jgi:lysine decarboxylase
MRDILMVHGEKICRQKLIFMNNLKDKLTTGGYNVIVTDELDDTISMLKSNARIVSLLFDWDNFSLDSFRELENINPKLPVFAIANSTEEWDLKLEYFKLDIDFLQYDQHLVAEDFCRIVQAIGRYETGIMPVFTSKLMAYAEENKYTFCTPGHLGGTAFTRSPAGARFYDFFGPEIFKADISISVAELGSLLDHSGPHLDAEELIAKVFGADRSLMVTNGTSTSNKIIGMFAAGDGDTILVDRNCHKSICQFMSMTNVVPIYLKPTRNAYGILGGIPKSEFSPASINKKIEKSPFAAKLPVYAVVTNSTYDGLFYKTDYIKQVLPVKTMHFDSAWVPYTNFHPIYKGLYGMSGDAKAGQVVVETQSTHKLLAAFSQASMIHLKGDFDFEVIDEAYMMHTSTSPFYPIVATCELSAAMMEGAGGFNLMEKAINRATAFRKEIKKLRHDADDWYFDVWQPESIDQAECWELKKNDKWHGFADQDDDHNFLDPIKVTVILPGIENNKMADRGIPASVVTMFLDDAGVIVEKTGPYVMLFLFSIGINKAKSMHLLSALNEFKAAYDANRTVKEVLPNLYAAHPGTYAGMKIQELCDRIHDMMKQHDLPSLMYNAFDILPEQDVTPHQAFQRLIKGQTKIVKLKELLNKTSAVMVLPYPPGVPLIMPGEKITAQSKVILDYLLLLEQIGKALPGFETDIHGVAKDADGDFAVKVLN